MPLQKATKRPSERVVYSSKPAMKQQTFRPRIKTVKVAVKDEEAERPRKRRKSQTTMTQLDFGKRSYLEAICDSDEGSGLESDPESTPKPKVMNRRRKLPAKTESQDTLTQFVKRSSDVSMMAISDSEDEDLLSDVELGVLHGNATEQKMHTSEDMLPVVDGDVDNRSSKLPQSGQEPKPDLPEQVLSVELATLATHNQSLLLPTTSCSPRTPKRRRVQPVPSSRSPPDSHISTQVTPRGDEESQIRSPLLERSVNIRALPRALHPGTPTKSSLRKRATPAAGISTVIQKESPTKQRVREFNARFAILEQENVEMRKSRGLIDRLLVTRSGATESETQYPLLGDETQNELMRINLEDSLVGSAPDAAQSLRAEIVRDNLMEVGEELEEKTGPEMPFSLTQAPDHAVDATENVVQASIEDVLIPSSQTRKFRQSTKTTSLNDSARKVDVRDSEDPELDESLPESTYNSASLKSVMPNRDTQDLASDQLMRETQQAVVEPVPSSPFALVHPSSDTGDFKGSRWASQSHQSLQRPSQATTVDETMTHSSFYTQHLGPLKTQPLFKMPEVVMSSSPIEGPHGLEGCVFTQAVSSPVMQPPGLTDVSSSPKLPEPKTPSMLRNLKAPLRLTDLLSESLDQSIPMPPSWQYDDDEEDDDEL